MAIEISPLRDGLGFGSRVRGLGDADTKDADTRRTLADLFEARGLIVFEDVEPSGRMHLAISDIFGPLKDHPIASVPRVDQDVAPGVIDMPHNPERAGIVEFGGKQLSSWLPWHFDHCYNNELNRAGVLRAITVAPEGGMTGFIDGIQLYEALSPDLRDAIEGTNILYTLNLLYSGMRFGKPEGLVELKETKGAREMQETSTFPRAIHPAVWTRDDGTKVLHVSPWMSAGIEGAENSEGDRLLEAVCQEINAKAEAYFHQWNTTDMLIWDNWRMLHAVSGIAPTESRRMQRTTIKGDYGLGRFEHGAQGHKMLEMTV